ncbi:MAG: transposase, partial [Candidatus Acidiferrales bacterium]
MITSPTQPVKPLINRVEITTDTVTGRGGLTLFSRYVRGTGLLAELDRLFGSIRKSGKGLPIAELFHQLLCFFLDGTSRHLVRFDEVKQDAGYGAGIETAPERMASSHMIKRFFGAFHGSQTWLFRRVLQQLFLWRLQHAQPGVIVLGIDTMVMDNNEAEQRHGVQPTYKKVKGFQPLQITWGRFIVDAVFRGGKKHSNYGDTVAEAVRHLVRFIRRRFRVDVPIVIRLDSGFFDQKLFALFEELGIGYICGGKLYEDLAAAVDAAPASRWAILHKPQQAWKYLDFGDRRKSWKQERRALYLCPLYEGEQGLLQFARPETVLYTNLGCGELIDGLLADAGLTDWTEAHRIIE